VTGRSLFGLLLIAKAFLVGPALASEETRFPIAITSNGNPVAELYRGADGSFRYAINDDIALGMSLGVSPIHLTRRAGAENRTSRWAPVFNLYREPRDPSGLGDGPLIREARTRQWFWTIGTNTDFVGGDELYVQSDLLQDFSLQTKAGFLVPLGRRWLLGGAITLDHSAKDDDTIDGSARAGGTDIGAFLGVEFNY
jgi:hypothetical protein